jgi:hypothetical protein
MVGERSEEGERRAVKPRCSGEGGWRVANCGGARRGGSVAMHHATTVRARRHVLGAACRGVASAVAIQERRLHNIGK